MEISLATNSMGAMLPEPAWSEQTVDRSWYMYIDMAWIEESDLPDVPAVFQAMSIKPEALDVMKRLNEVLSFGH